MQVLNIFHVLIAIALVAFVLIQKGQGATAGAAFGSGASGTVFGSRGAGNFLTRTTWVLATLFCTISLTMAVLVSRTSATPENDLGVLGTSQPAPAVDSDTENNIISVGSEESEGTDLPSFNTATDDINDTEAIENAVTEDAQAVDEGSGGEGSDSNDS